MLLYFCTVTFQQIQYFLQQTKERRNEVRFDDEWEKKWARERDREREVGGRESRAGDDSMSKYLYLH